MADELLMMGGGCCGCFLCLAMFAWTFLVQGLGPNQYGIVKNSLSGAVGHRTYRGGIYVLAPWEGFITFPATEETLELSRNSPDGYPPQFSRTGHDVHDTQSGGQPVKVSCSMQFKFLPSTLREVYMSFNSYYKVRRRYLLLVSNAVSFTVQEFTPHDFWLDRKKISDRMFEKVNMTLWKDGFVTLQKFQILRVDFPPKYENMMTSVQVAEQSREVRKAKQQVQTVVQSIEIMRSKNLATIANITAGAQADAKEIQARALRTAFNLKQHTKAKEYAELQKELELDFPHMAEYLKIKTVSTFAKAGELLMGFPQMKNTKGDSL